MFGSMPVTWRDKFDSVSGTDLQNFTIKLVVSYLGPTMPSTQMAASGAFSRIFSLLFKRHRIHAAWSATRHRRPSGTACENIRKPRRD
jgi:hypothetical protein